MKFANNGAVPAQSCRLEIVTARRHQKLGIVRRAAMHLLRKQLRSSKLLRKCYVGVVFFCTLVSGIYAANAQEMPTIGETVADSTVIDGYFNL